MRISLIIPAHNSSRTICKTLTTVFGQTRGPDEVIVVDDGSTDDIAGALRPFKDRLTYIRTVRQGAAAARNTGAKVATGDALFFCDADLELKPQLLERLSEALERDPDAAFAYCAFRSSDGHLFGSRDFDPVEIRKNNYISTMSLIRRRPFPGFDESLPRFQDWDLWLTIIERGGRGVRVPETLFSVIVPGIISRRGGLSRLAATGRIRRKHHLPWRFGDVWLAFKESVKARRF